MYGELLKTYRKGKIFVLSLLIISLLFGFCVKAQEDVSLGLRVNPQIFELDVWPGEEIKRKISLGNNSSVPLPIEVRMTNFTAKENSGEMMFDEVLQDPLIASRKWFKIEDPDFILDIGEKKEINFTISVPENAELGGHYAVMIFEPRPPSFYFEENQVRNLPVIGVIFMISVKSLSITPEAEQKLEIVEFSLPEEERLLSLERTLSRFTAGVAEAADLNITKTSPSGFILRIRNNDIYHIKPSGKVLIYNFLGQEVSEASISKKTILPGKTRSFPVEFDPNPSRFLKWLPVSIRNFFHNLFLGRYEARLQLQAESPLKAEVVQPDIYDTLIFFSIPWKVCLVMVFLVVILIKYRRRIRKSIEVLIRGT